eukprot:SAG25_NODE_6527_length_552_cov_38.543046_1_plen_86_part_01
MGPKMTAHRTKEEVDRSRSARSAIYTQIVEPSRREPSFEIAREIFIGRSKNRKVVSEFLWGAPRINVGLKLKLKLYILSNLETHCL